MVVKDLQGNVQSNTFNPLSEEPECGLDVQIDNSVGLISFSYNN